MKTATKTTKAKTSGVDPLRSGSMVLMGSVIGLVDEMQLSGYSWPEAEAFIHSLVTSAIDNFQKAKQ